MSHRNRGLIAVIGGLMALLLPAHTSAQEAMGDWSRIYSHQCAPTHPCPARVGIVWDSTNAAPTYPQVMREVGIGGEAVVTFEVREDGTVDPASVTFARSSNRAFDANSVAAVRRWRFGVEAEGRPSGPIAVEVHLIFGHLGDCTAGQPTTQSGWAGWNQLVIAGCTFRIPRDQVQPHAE